MRTISVSITEKLCLSVEEASVLSGIGVKTLRKWIDARSMPAFKVGERILINREAFEAYLKKKAMAREGCI